MVKRKIRSGKRKLDKHNEQIPTDRGQRENWNTENEGKLRLEYNEFIMIKNNKTPILSGITRFLKLKTRAIAKDGTTLDSRVHLA